MRRLVRLPVVSIWMADLVDSISITKLPCNVRGMNGNYANCKGASSYDDLIDVNAFLGLV